MSQNLLTLPEDMVKEILSKLPITDLIRMLNSNSALKTKYWDSFATKIQTELLRRKAAKFISGIVNIYHECNEVKVAQGEREYYLKYFKSKPLEELLNALIQCVDVGTLGHFKFENGDEFDLVRHQANMYASEKCFENKSFEELAGILQRDKWATEEFNREFDARDEFRKYL